MIEIKIPSDNPKLIAAFGLALTSYAEEKRQEKKVDNFAKQYASGDPSQDQPSIPNFGPPRANMTEEELKEAFQKDEVVIKQTDVKAVDLSGGSLFEETATATVNGGKPPVDEKGVKKDPAFCATAQVPFYKPGNKYVGQWKKKTGVSQEAYDTWYQGELLLVANPKGPGPGVQVDQATKPVNTAAAFGPTGPATVEGPPTDIGGLMKWISELTVAGKLTQASVDQAWAVNALAIADLAPPVGQAQIEINVGRMHTYLSSVAVAKQ